jgi:hypothetical protein
MLPCAKRNLVKLPESLFVPNDRIWLDNANFSGTKSNG